jgi:Na+/H+-translocating membrane pyrophosphatase
MLFVGGMIPVVFSALAMNSVGKAAMDMVYEVRRQFKIPVSWKEQVNQNMPNVLISLLKLLYAK